MGPRDPGTWFAREGILRDMSQARREDHVQTRLDGLVAILTDQYSVIGKLKEYVCALIRISVLQTRGHHHFRVEREHVLLAKQRRGPVLEAAAAAAY